MEEKNAGGLWFAGFTDHCANHEALVASEYRLTAGTPPAPVPANMTFRNSRVPPRELVTRIRPQELEGDLVQ